MAAGDFSSSQLLQVKLKAEQMWADSALSASFQAHAEALVAIKQNQTASVRFPALSDPDKDNTVLVNFINPCAVAVQDCSADCVIDGPEVETGGKAYQLTLCKEVPFSVDRFKFRTNTYNREETVAKALMMAVNKLDEWWAQQALVKLKAFAGINVAPSPWTWAAGTTSVPSADYNLQMIAHLINQASLNRISNPYFIDNGGLYVPWLNAKLEGGNSDGKGDAARTAAIRMYFDQWNFGPAGLTEDTFMISPDALAFATQVRNPDTPETVGGNVNTTYYTVESNNIPGLKYDAFYQVVCKTVNGESHIVDSWKLKTRGDILLNPEGCPIVIGGNTYQSTGVISYTKV